MRNLNRRDFLRSTTAVAVVPLTAGFILTNKARLLENLDLVQESFEVRGDPAQAIARMVSDLKRYPVLPKWAVAQSTFRVNEGTARTDTSVRKLPGCEVREGFVMENK